MVVDGKLFGAEKREDEEEKKTTENQEQRRKERQTSIKPDYNSGYDE